MSSVLASGQANLADRLLPLTHWLGAETARNIELGQAKTRLICTLAGLCGFAIMARFVALPAGIIATAILFPLYAIGFALHARRYPAPSRARRGVSILVDNLVASYIASFGGGFAAYIGFSFLITMGWGLRFASYIARSASLSSASALGLLPASGAQQAMPMLAPTRMPLSA